MSRIKNLLDVLKIKEYSIAAAITAALGFLVLYYLTLSTTARLSIEIFFDMNGFWFSLFSLASIAVIAVLFAINNILILFRLGKFRKFNRRGVTGNSAGIILGAFASGCPTCGSLLFAIFGSPLALFAFPFWGLELKLASIILLSTSIYYLLGDIKNCKGVCRT